MLNISLEKLNPHAAEKIKPFFQEILGKYHENIHSIYVTGTAITDDFDINRSDVNSIFVLNDMDHKFLKLIAPLGKKYSKQKVAAPLIMTPEYIRTSLDVFPIEFLNFKLIHTAVYGDNILEDIEIGRLNLRLQCERELKTKLILLRQGYVSSLGDTKLLTENIVNSITGYIPMFRGIIMLLGKEPPVSQGGLITALSEAAGINTDIFAKVLKEKRERIKLSIEDLHTIFEDYYTATEQLGRMVNEIKE